MAAWKNSSLAFSDHNTMRNGHGLLKHTKMRIGKQDFVEHKMFGSKRKNIQLGKTFRKSGKGMMKGATSSDKMDKKAGGISPSVAEFDKMMSSIAKGSSKSGSRKSMFSRKQFG